MTEPSPTEPTAEVDSAPASRPTPVAGHTVTQQAHASGASTIIQVGRDATIRMVGHSLDADVVELIEDDPIGECPYPGLSPFGPEQAKWFFGRDRALAGLRMRLDEARREGGLVAVIGASGAGKSSLLRAGLVSSVTTDGYGDADSRKWPLRVFTPTETPLLALAGELADLLGENAEELAVVWSAEPTACATALRRTLGPARVLLVVDQFEQLFTDCDNELARSTFVELLDAVTAGPDAPAMVVLGLRADFYGHCLAYPYLAVAVADAPVQLAQLTRSELERVVLGPAEQVGLTVEPALLQVLLADMGGGAIPGEDPSGRLPLLADALRATWFKRSGKTLTLAGYQDTGGIQGAIATTADRTFRRLGDAAAQAARLVFLRLIRIGTDTEHTRRRVTHGELSRGLPDPAAVTEVVDAYTNRRLLTTERGGITITHEALLRAWPRLRSWIDEDRAGQVFRQELETQVEAWEHASQDASALHRGATLENSERWANLHADDVTESVTTFLAASRRAETGRRRFRRNIVVLVAVLALVASGMAVYAFAERGSALAQGNIAVARLVAGESSELTQSQSGLAKQLALISYRLDAPTGQTAVFSSLGVPGLFDGADSVADVAATRDGRTLALSTGSAIALWSTAGHADGRITGLSVGAVTVSPNSRLLAATTVGGRRTGVLRLWSITDPDHPTPLASLMAGTGQFESVAISSDSRLLAAGTTTGAILIWDVTDPGAPRALPGLSGHPGGVDSLTFAPSGRLLASSGADHLIRLWQLADPTHPTLESTVDGYHGNDGEDVTAYTKVVHRMAFSPDGTILAAPGDGNTSDVRLWDVRNAASPQPITSSVTSDRSHTCETSLRSISFSPDGHALATVCDTALDLWQVIGPTGTATLTDVNQLPISDEGNGPAVFEPQGQLLIHAGRNGVQDWDLSDISQPGAAGSYAIMNDGLDGGTAFSSGPRRLLVSVNDSGGVLVDLTGQPPHRTLATLPGGDAGSAAATLSPDGSVLADSETSGPDLVLRLRATTLGAPILATLDSPIEDGVYALAFSPDGRVLAVADNSENTDDVVKPPTVKLFDVSNPHDPRQLVALPGNAYTVSFSPDGRLLVATTGDTLLSWDVSNPTQPVQQATQQLSPKGMVATAVFRPDGRYLAVGDDSGTIRLWPVVQDRLSPTPVVFHIDGFDGYSLAFNPSGDVLALTSMGAFQGTGPMTSPHIELWNLGNIQEPTFEAAFAFAPGSLGTGPVAYSGSGSLLATDTTGTLDVWSTNSTINAEDICASIGDVITPAQWQTYVPNEPYDPPCPEP